MSLLLARYHHTRTSMFGPVRAALEQAINHVWSLSLAIALATTANTASAQKTPVPNGQARGNSAQSSVVAVIDANPITRSRLANAAVERYGVDVLDNIVNRYLIMQACQAKGIEVTKVEISGEVQRLAGKFGLTMDAYLKLLQDERDISPNQYSTDIIYPMLALRKLVASEIEVTQPEFNEAYLSQFGEAVKCRLIMKSSRVDAEKLQRQASAAPDTFAELAKRHSDDESSASVGGLIPPIRRHTSDSRLEDAAFGLQDGEVSPLIQLGDQWVFVQSIRRIPAATPSAEAWPAIQEQIRDSIRDTKMKGAASDLFEKLQTEARVVKVLGDVEAMKKNPGVAAIVNDQRLPISQVADVCVDRHGVEVLDGEINRQLLSNAMRAAGKKVEPADVDAEIRRAAAAFGFIDNNNQPDVDAWMTSVLDEGRVTRDVYLADSVWPSVALGKLVEDSIQLSDADLKEGFESAYGPRVEVLAIVLSDQRTAQKIWKMARDNSTDEFFGRLATQYSVEPVSSSNMGKVPPIRKHSGQPAVEKEAFAMKAGELSGIIATGGKYIILRCQGFTDPVVSDPAAVRDELVRDLSERKRRTAMAKKIEELREQAEIDNFFAAAKKASVAKRATPAVSR